MTDLRESTTPPQATPSASDAAADPLHNLYRMSRTAGLGSGDYVAINSTAVLSLILGLAGVLSMLYPLLLIVAGAALVCGVLALIQIRSSNGTQSGRLFAALGILLALGLGGLAGARLAIGGIEAHRDEAAIDALVQRLSKLLVEKKYDEAYQSCFSAAFQAQVSQQEFIDRVRTFERVSGGIKAFDWGKKADIQSSRGNDVKRAAAGSILRFNGISEVATQPILFVKEKDDWQIDGIQSIFDKDTRSKPTGGSPPQGPAPTFTLPGAPGAPTGSPVQTPNIPPG